MRHRVIESGCFETKDIRETEWIGFITSVETEEGVGNVSQFMITTRVETKEFLIKTSSFWFS